MLFMSLVERHEAEAFWVEVELYFTYGAITVLGDDKVSDILYFGIVRFIVSWSVNERNDVGILLDRA